MKIYSVEFLVQWIQNTGVAAAEQFAKGAISEEECQRLLKVDRESLTAELLKTIEHSEAPEAARGCAMSFEPFYTPEAICCFVQASARYIFAARERGELTEEEERQALAADCQKFAAEMEKTIRHRRVRTGREVRDG